VYKAAMRVLLLADDCNPEWPSLPIVGYKACRAIADHADVVVATHVRNQPVLDRHGFGNAEVVYVDNEYVAAPLHRLSTVVRRGNQVNWTAAIAFNYPSYLAFEREVFKRFEADLVQGRFDVVHRVTPMSPALPSPIAAWAPQPFVLGPLNGALPWPKEFQAELRREREYLRYVRDVYKVLPYRRRTLKHADAILASFEHTIDDLPAWVRDKTIDFPEVGIDPELFQYPGERPDKEKLTFIFVGRFVALKLLDVALRVFAESDKLRQHRLVLVGDGVERPHLEEQIRSSGLEDVVELAGWLDQAEVGKRMRDADVFFFPSIRELGAGVVIEAMGCGTVPVVVDYGGPGGLVTEDCGAKVAMGDKDALTKRFVAALERYVDDPELRRRHSRASHARAIDYYSWDAKARKTLEVYDWVLKRRRDKPVFDA
jgi:glycosyltransferase involved in cell wall biosynthesis